MSERLTKRKEYGCACWNGDQNLITHRRYLEMLDVMAKYEDVLYDADGNEVISLARLRELAQAERESRVVVLPKKGDRLYYAPYAKSTTGYDGELVFLRNTGDGSGEVRRVDVLVMFDNWAGGVPIKRTWRTKEEAEAARALAATEPKGDATCKKD